MFPVGWALEAGQPPNSESPNEQIPPGYVDAIKEFFRQDRRR